MGALYSDVLAPQDIATNGALCSLASFTRGELRARVIENVNMREYLETVPEVSGRSIMHAEQMLSEPKWHSIQVALASQR